MGQKVIRRTLNGAQTYQQGSGQSETWVSDPNKATVVDAVKADMVAAVKNKSRFGTFDTIDAPQAACTK